MIFVIFLRFQPYHVLKWHFKGYNDGKNNEKMMLTITTMMIMMTNIVIDND